MLRMTSSLVPNDLQRQKSIFQRTKKGRTRLETEDAHGKTGECKERMRLKLAKITKAELCN